MNGKTELWKLPKYDRNSRFVRISQLEKSILDAELTIARNEQWNNNLRTAIAQHKLELAQLTSLKTMA
jgi:hypothetical protein